MVWVDANIGLRNLDLALGPEGRIVYDIVDVVLANVIGALHVHLAKMILV